MSEKKPITLLDEHLINKIAAGEVIEDASSVLKELLENAIDSGATTLEIVTKMAGRALIMVSDNGCGIKKEELPLAICRHATSKIDKIDDLFALETFGFRGEALASIAAISKCSILSSVENSLGHKLIVEGGRVIDCHVHSRQQGTTIEVRDLFFNVPVRKKFQKSVASAFKEMQKTLWHVALTFPDISFRWIDDDKEEFFLPARRDLETTIGTLFGNDWQENLFSIQEDKKQKSLSGMISLPYFSRANRTGQFLFVNNRPISSPFISHAVLEGYGTRLSIGRHPHFVLFLKIPSYMIDVNVHPQKKEIRFQEEKEIEDFVRTTIQNSLEKRHKPPAFTSTLCASLPPVTLPSVPLSVQIYEKKSVLEEKKLFPHTFSLLAVIEHSLLIEKEKRIYIVDALAAQKRILFEKIEKEDPSLSVQALLFPITMELSGIKRKVCEKNLPLFQKLKIEIRSLGEGFFIIDALPEGIDQEKIFDFLDALVEEREEKKIAFSLNHLIKRRVLSFHEAYKMVETLFCCVQFSICPEGLPTILPWPSEEIRRLFLCP